MSEFIDTFVKFFNFYVPRVGLLTPCFVPRGGFLYTRIVQGEGGFLLPSSRIPEVCPRKGMVLDETDTCITETNLNSKSTKSTNQIRPWSKHNQVLDIPFFSIFKHCLEKQSTQQVLHRDRQSVCRIRVS